MMLSLVSPLFITSSDAVDGILVGAVVAALGYVGKEIVQTWRAWRTEQRQRRVRLHQLDAMLQASRTAFLAQREQAGRLADRLRRRNEDPPDEPGLERLFAHYYARFDSEEKDLHDVIRAYTEHALRPINQTMLTWLQTDTDHRTNKGKTGEEAELAVQLNQLDAHLLLWLAKYEAWIPNRPDHALVYLADEQEHGLGFPRGIEDRVARVLAGTE